MENNQKHILVVDDDNRIRNLLKEYLIENNYTVSTSENSDDAKIKLLYFKFDLIICLFAFKLYLLNGELYANYGGVWFCWVQFG